MSDMEKRTVDIEFVFDAPNTAQAMTTTTQPSVTTKVQGQEAARNSESRKLRLFFGVTLSAEARLLVEQGVAAAKASRREGQDVAIKWSPPSNYHVTIKFIGEIDETDVQALITRMETELRQSKNCRPFAMTLKGAGKFPAEGQPRILWVGIGDESAPFLTALRLAAERALRLDNTSNGDLIPHCTVARCNAKKKVSPQSNAAVEKFFDDCKNLKSESFLVSSIELYLSSPVGTTEALRSTKAEAAVCTPFCTHLSFKG